MKLPKVEPQSFLGQTYVQVIATLLVLIVVSFFAYVREHVWYPLWQLLITPRILIQGTVNIGLVLLMLAFCIYLFVLGRKLKKPPMPVKKTEEQVSLQVPKTPPRFVSIKHEGAIWHGSKDWTTGEILIAPYCPIHSTTELVKDSGRNRYGRWTTNFDCPACKKTILLDVEDTAYLYNSVRSLVSAEILRIQQQES